MDNYIVGYYTPKGRQVIHLSATSRENARTQAYALGLEVVDVSEPNPTEADYWDGDESDKIQY